MKWEKKKHINCISWYGSISYPNKEDSFMVFEIQQWEKNEFCLPRQIFPSKNGLTQKVKTLDEAKFRCEKWFKDFIKHCYEKQIN